MESESDFSSTSYQETITNVTTLDADNSHISDYETKDRTLFKKHCKEHKYYPSIFPAQKRIVVIGDIHGDYEVAVESLRVAGAIDKNLNWIGKTTFVVQIGDQIDRCRPFTYKCDDPRATFEDENSDVRIMKLYTKIHKQALNAGGAVISLLGNHELMNSLGVLSYVSFKGIDEFKDYKDPDNPNKAFPSGKEARSHAFAPGHEYGKFMACTRLSAVIVGDFLFVHAGIVPEFVSKLNIKSHDDLYRINYRVRKWLLGLIDKHYVADIIGNSGKSMFWDRVLGAIPPNMNNNHPKCVKFLEPVLKVLNIDKMVIGHTPQFVFKHGINHTCNHKLWRVDIGASKAFHPFDQNKSATRKIQVLEILDNKDINVLKYK